LLKNLSGFQSLIVQVKKVECFFYYAAYCSSIEQSWTCDCSLSHAKDTVSTDKQFELQATVLFQTSSNMSRGTATNNTWYVVVISEFLEHQSKAKRTRAPAYSRALIHQPSWTQALAVWKQT